MTNFNNVKATVIHSQHHGRGIMKNYFKLEDGNILSWSSKSAPYMTVGSEVTLSARFNKMDWVTGFTIVSHVRIKN